MFTLKDIPTFFWSFFLVLPLVSIIHQLGHTFFVVIFGGKGSFDLGRGRILFRIGFFKFRKLYFLDSFCDYRDLKIDNKLTHALVYLGGTFFNLLTVIITNTLIAQEILPPTLFFYQFAYFSVYFVFFALLPVHYGKGHPSDGMALIELIKYGTKNDLID